MLKIKLTAITDNQGFWVERVRKFCKPPRKRASSQRAGINAIKTIARINSAGLFNPMITSTCSTYSFSHLSKRVFSFSEMGINSFKKESDAETNKENIKKKELNYLNKPDKILKFSLILIPTCPNFY